jgi:hypothetical protein
MNLSELNPSTYTPHFLHSAQADWAETNCYVDLWIGLLHGLGLQPEACLGFIVGADYEDDQWTFFKQPASDLWTLYGIQVEELSLWQPVLEHCVTQVHAGKVPLLEADSFYLPDTRATDYRTNHVKTTIGITLVDPADKRLRYFHNAGFYELQGEDFEGLFRFAERGAHSDDLSSGHPRWLPPFCEIAKLQRRVALPAAELQRRALGILRERLDTVPEVNPFSRLRSAWPEHVDLLLSRGLDAYHGYTFSMLRQCGACYSLLGAHTNWLAPSLPQGPAAAEHFSAISQRCKSVLMNLARVVNSKKPKDFTEQLDAMQKHWESGVKLLLPARVSRSRSQ